MTNDCSILFGVTTIPELINRRPAYLSRHWQSNQPPPVGKAKLLNITKLTRASGDYTLITSNNYDQLRL